MSKRKLSRRQAWRIEKIQQEREARAAKRDANLDQLDGDADNSGDKSNNTQLGPEQLGLVIAHFGTQVEVESLSLTIDKNPPVKEIAEKEQTGEPQERIRRRCHFRANLGSLVTGDHVVFRDGNPMGVIEFSGNGGKDRKSVV